LEDIPERAYRDLNEDGQQALKLAGIDYIGQMMDFINPEPLFEKYKSFDDVPEQELGSLPTTWQGRRLPPNTLYVVVTDFDEAGGSTAVSLKKAVAMKMEDRVVAAEGDKLFAAGSSAEARKNVAQGEKAEGGVWGVRKRGPAR
jgi:hypothetical protein